MSCSGLLCFVCPVLSETGGLVGAWDVTSARISHPTTTTANLLSPAVGQPIHHGFTPSPPLLSRPLPPNPADIAHHGRCPRDEYVSLPAPSALLILRGPARAPPPAS